MGLLTSFPSADLRDRPPKILGAFRSRGVSTTRCCDARRRPLRAPTARAHGLLHHPACLSPILASRAWSPASLRAQRRRHRDSVSQMCILLRACAHKTRNRSNYRSTMHAVQLEVIGAISKCISELFRSYFVLRSPASNSSGGLPAFNFVHIHCFNRSRRAHEDGAIDHSSAHIHTFEQSLHRTCTRAAPPSYAPPD